MSINPTFNLNEEIMDEWLVTAEQKRIWNVELNLSRELIRVCNKHKITLCAGFGTLLGAVRHNGFIPWDNDMDFFVSREDYNKLKELEDEFKFPYFLQTVKTEKGNWFRGFIRIVDCNTTCITPMDTYNEKIHNGIYIDVIPIDKVPNPEDKKEIKKFERDLRILRTLCFVKVYGHHRYQKKSVPIKLAAQVLQLLLCPVSIFRLNDAYEKLCQKYNDTDYDGYHIISFGYGKGDRYHFTLSESDFDPIISHKFENLEVPIPQNYDSHLKKIYGANYMEFPSMKDRSFHYDNNMKPDIPYSVYFAEFKKK